MTGEQAVDQIGQCGRGGQRREQPEYQQDARGDLGAGTRRR